MTGPSVLAVRVQVVVGSAPIGGGRDGAPVTSFGTNGTSIVDLSGGGEAINDLVAATVPIRVPAPSGSRTKGRTARRHASGRALGARRPLGGAASRAERFDAAAADSSISARRQVRRRSRPAMRARPGSPSCRRAPSAPVTSTSAGRRASRRVARYRPDGTLAGRRGDGKLNAKFPGAEHYTVSAVARRADGRTWSAGPSSRPTATARSGSCASSEEGAVERRSARRTA